jgi:hypothetical protein
MNPSWVAGLVRGWVDLYTSGAPITAREARRAEIDDDLWCLDEEASSDGRSPSSLGTEMFIRLLGGMPADISWRLAQRGSPAPTTERTSSMSTRVIGALAIVFGASWATVVLLMAAIGPSIWTGSFGVLPVVLSVGGSLAFAATIVALLVQFQDRLRASSVMGGLVAAIGAVLSVTGQSGGLTLLLPIGSIWLVWDLAKGGVFSRMLAVVHAASAIPLFALIVIALTAPDMGAAGSAYIALGLPFMLSWIAIGTNLMRGVPIARQPAAGG